MNGWSLDDLGICAALTAAAAILLSRRLTPGRARAAWLGLLIAGIANALALDLSGTNPDNTNFVHYYLGAKYPIPYGDFYEMIQAALGRPQIEIRDLDRPATMLRSDPREQRAYYIDLMRAAKVPFDATAPLDSLARRAIESGVIEREAEQILARGLAADRIEPFRRDVRAAFERHTWQVLTSDYGYNGSPFYAAVRHLDPTLYRRFGRGTAYLDLAWQIFATLLIAWLAGEALRLQLTGKIAIAAFLFASWDFVCFALPGLLFGEFWLPVMVAIVAMRRRNAIVGGAADAWAGLIKLFPFVLMLPALVRLGRALVKRERFDETAGWSLRFLIACALAVPVLGLL